MALNIAAALLLTAAVIGLFKLGISLLFTDGSQLWHRLLGLAMCLLATLISLAIVLPRL